MSLDHGWCGCKSRPGLVWLETTNPDLGWVSGVVGGRGWGYEVGLGGLIGMAHIVFCLEVFLRASRLLTLSFA